MARYIDAHRVENLLTMCGNYHGVIWLESVKSIIHDVSTENVVKVVRCKDCKYKNNCKMHKDEEGGIFGDDDFCSYGERKDE